MQGSVRIVFRSTHAWVSLECSSTSAQASTQRECTSMVSSRRDGLSAIWVNSLIVS